MRNYSIGKIIEFTSDTFPRVAEDDECPNEEIRGFAISKFLCAELEAYGLEADILCAEDWGFHNIIVGSEYGLGFGCSGEGDTFIIQIIPSKAYYRKWFRKIDISADVTKLALSLYDIIEKSTKVKSGPTWA